MTDELDDLIAKPILIDKPIYQLNWLSIGYSVSLLKPVLSADTSSLSIYRIKTALLRLKLN